MPSRKQASPHLNKIRRFRLMRYNNGYFSVLESCIIA